MVRVQALDEVEGLVTGCLCFLSFSLAHTLALTHAHASRSKGSKPVVGLRHDPRKERLQLRAPALEDQCPRHARLEVVCGLWVMGYRLWSMVCGLKFMVCCLWFIVYVVSGSWLMVYG